MKIISTIIAAVLLIVPSFALAHVVVRPASVGVGAYQTFTIGVPTEKDIATTEVRLVIPEGLESVRPNVKPGWTIELVKTGEGHDAMVSEIIWKGGSIGADFRDDFLFSAKAPPTETKLTWKAYQTYSDGSVVSWDQDPSVAEDAHDDAATEEAMEGEEASEPEPEDFSKSGPYSTTDVQDDLAADDGHGEKGDSKTKELMWKSLPSLLGLIAIGIALAALIRRN